MADQEVILDLIKAGVHFGHQSKKWNPKMRPFILEARNGIHIINVEETARQIDEAAKYLSDLSSKGKKILFVGCKRQAQDAVKEAAKECKQFYVNHRWLGGTLTNMSTIKNSIERLKYLEGIERSPEYKAMGKKELAALNRERLKLDRNLQGIRNMDGLPDVMVVVDCAREHIAVAEARRLKIPIVAMADTNADPDLIEKPVAANDDAIRSIRVVLQKLVDPVIEASANRKRTPLEKAEEKLAHG